EFVVAVFGAVYVNCDQHERMGLGASPMAQRDGFVHIGVAIVLVPTAVVLVATVVLVPTTVVFVAAAIVLMVAAAVILVAAAVIFVPATVVLVVATAIVLVTATIATVATGLSRRGLAAPAVVVVEAGVDGVGLTVLAGVLVLPATVVAVEI